MVNHSQYFCFWIVTYMFYLFNVINWILYFVIYLCLSFSAFTCAIIFVHLLIQNGGMLLIFNVLKVYCFTYFVLFMCLKCIYLCYNVFLY